MQKWEQEEIDLFISKIGHGITYKEISKKFLPHRSVNQLSRKAGYLGLSNRSASGRRDNRLSLNEYNKAKRLWNNGYPTKYIANQLGITKNKLVGIAYRNRHDFPIKEQLKKAG